MAEVASQDWLECLQPSRKKELALWKVSKQKKKKKKIGKERKRERKRESDKQCSKGRIAFWCRLYSASFKEQDVNRTDATSNMTCISY